MAISVLQEAHNEIPSGGGTATTIAVTLTVAAGSALHVYVMENASASGGSISLSDNRGQAYTGNFQVSDASRLAWDFYLIGAAAGSTTITATFTLGAFVAGIWVKEIGQASAFQVGIGQLQIAPGAGTDAVSSTAATPTSQPALLSAFTFGDNNADTTVVGTGFSAGSGITTWPLFGATNVGVSESLRLTSTAAKAATWTATAGGGANRWKSVVAIFTEGPAAAAQVPFTRKQPAFIQVDEIPPQRRTRLVIDTPGPPKSVPFSATAQADVARRAWDPGPLEEALRRRPTLVVDTPGPPKLVPFSRAAQADTAWRAWDPPPLDLAVIRRAKIVVDTPAVNAAVPFSRAAQPFYYPIAEVPPYQRINRIPVNGPDIGTQVPFSRAAHQQALSQWTEAPSGLVLPRRLVPPTLPVMAGLKLWLRADLGVTKDGSNNVSQWDDQSGNGNHCVQSTPGSTPFWNASDGLFNGKPTLVFNGGWLLTGATNIVPAGNARTILLVHRRASGSNWLFEFRSAAPAFRVAWNVNGTLATEIYSDGASNQAAIPSVGNYDKPTINEIAWDGNTAHDITARLSGYVAPPVVHTSGSGTTSDTGTTGYQIGGAASLIAAEVIVFDRVLSAAEGLAIRQYLAARYGIDLVDQPVPFTRTGQAIALRGWEPPPPMPPVLWRSSIDKIPPPPNGKVTPPLLAFVGLVEFTLAEIGGPTQVVVATIDLTTAEVGGPSQTVVVGDSDLTLKGDT